ncbi:ABC transporter permease [Staphylococcus delphini]|uniref:ABC transporter permease n=1 Tax=Staphylococcus delphini TaxID=53344 RepID=UPI0023B28B9C|nr:ABC transporter permease [Staphylococcus delphini]MDE9751758.1 ABC transporter permease [Staphylococcus delphini]MDE9789035.1 ABC transporter permease [Staphylococcus delphini]MDE9791332.1 ABC transporter permease [Staphylococcus delphini]MDE9793662.1 ABC transporter permease [Staphylococcus delphini]MDE9795988.1 ABC transporter permease [Staphylococcus delphini]
MSIFHLVNFNIWSIIKNKNTYLGLALILIIPLFYTITKINNDVKLSGENILSIAVWLFCFWGVIMIASNITRDISQGTIQLYLSSTTNRTKYFFSQAITIFIIELLVAFVLLVYTFIMQEISGGKSLEAVFIWRLIGIYTLHFLFYGLFLMFVALLVKNSSLVFSIAVFLMLIIPVATNLIPFIPEYGKNVKDILNYVPFNFLVTEIWTASLKLNNWQIFSSVISIVLLVILNLFTIHRKDY